MRLFETAMQKVTASKQGSKPSVFDRLTSQAAQGNTAAAATASAVVRRLQRSATAAKKQGNAMTYGHDRLDLISISNTTV